MWQHRDERGRFISTRRRDIRRSGRSQGRVLPKNLPRCSSPRRGRSHNISEAGEIDLSGLVDEQPILELEQHSQSSIHDTIEAIPIEKVAENTPIESSLDKSDNTSPVRPSSPQ